MSSNEPPDEGSGRPPIHSLDEPIDDSGADEVERKRAERRSQAELPVAAVEALKLKALGFTIMPLPTNAKSPPPADWESAAKNNPAVFLKNPGTHNYAVLPPPGCFGWDVDKGVPALLETILNSLGVYLPDTMMTMTPNGSHWFFRWPEDLPRPKGPMFGLIVTRWPAGDEGQGYLVGPGSVVVQDNGSLGVYQAMGLDDPDPIADLPRKWAEAALAWRPVREVKAGPVLVEVRPHYELPDSIPAGMRYESIRGYTAHLYNRGLSVDEMWGLVQTELATRFVEALTLKELRERFERTVSDIESRLGEPKALPDLSVSRAPSASRVEAEGEHSTPSQESSPHLPARLRAVPSEEFAEQLRSRDPIDYLVPGWVPGHALTVIAGHPKSMKSLAVLQMLGAFVAGGAWLGEEVGTSGSNVGIYLTREGSSKEMLNRTEALIARHGRALGNRLRFVYEEPVEFTRAQYVRVSEMLADIESELSVLPGKLRVMLVLDPLRDLMPGDGDENEAKTMALVKRWCRDLIAEFDFLSIVLVHHLRKSASGSTGLEMSGSGAMYGAVDATVIWKAKKEAEPGDDDDESSANVLVSIGEMFGSYRVEGRGEAPFSGRWRFDAVDGLIVPGVGRQVGASGRAVPGTGVAGVVDALRGVATHGASARTIGELVGISETNARVQLNRLREKGKAVKEGGLWFTDGLAPHQGGDVILPLARTDDEEEASAPAARESSDDPDGEVWVDPVHKLD